MKYSMMLAGHFMAEVIKMNKRFLSILAIAAIGLLTVVNSLVLVRVNASAARLSAANVPQVISYQGRLTDAAGNLLTGNYDMRFCLYADPSGGSSLWCETQAVPVSYGVFSVMLGSGTPIPVPLFDGSDRYLGVKVGDDSELMPRRILVSVGYAIKADEASTAATADYATSAGNADYASSAGNADMVDSKHAGDFASVSHSHDASEITSGTMAPERISGTAWTSANDGAGSGLDADMVDGRHASDFASTDHVHTNIQGFFWPSVDFAYITAGVNCGNTPRTANQLCQEAGFSSAVYAKGYYHGECAGPSMLSCEGAECFPAATNCVGRSNNIGEIREGDGSTVFDVGGCGGWNPGWFIRLQCRP
jgi:hypothetical protein